MICNKCGTEVPDNYKFCTKCGNDLSEQRAAEAAVLKCPKCGAAIAPGDKFCISCGADLSAIQEPKQGPATEEPKDNTPRCPKCGAEIVPGQKFCMTCGARLDAELANPAEETSEETVPENEAANQEAEDDLEMDAAGEETTKSDPESENAKQSIEETDTEPKNVAVEQDEVTEEPVIETDESMSEPVLEPKGDESGAGAESDSESELAAEPADAQVQTPQGQYAQNQYYQGQPQGGDPNVFYAQTQPQYQQTGQANVAKSNRGKTPAWVWVLIAILAAAIIFCILWFFVLPNNHQSTSNNAAVSQTQDVNGNEAAEQGNAGSSRIYVNENSEWAGDAENKLGALAVNKIEQAKGWRNKNLMGDCNIVDYSWNGNTLTFIVEVNINMNAASDIEYIYYDQYYTYVKYKNVYRDENGDYQAKTETPNGKKLNLYDSSGSRHMVAGYATEAEARSAAGV